MSYFEFLGRPFNLPFVGALVLGLAVLVANRRVSPDLFYGHAWLLALAVTGLTLNGAIHDLRLGDPAGRFPAVLVISGLVAGAAAFAARRIRDRLFPPVETVRFNEPGLEGAEARVVSRRVEEDPGSGRAQWHDGEGVLHFVTCHTASGSVGFGTTVTLEEFDDEHGSYLVRPT